MMNENKRNPLLHKVVAFFLLAIGGFLLVIGARVLNEYIRQPLVSPIATVEELATILSLTPTNNTEPQKRRKPMMVYGFLPYWNLSTAVIHPELTHLGYFSLALTSDGSLDLKSDDGAAGMRGFRGKTLERIRSDLNERGQKFELLITMMDADEISSFLLNPKATEKSIETLKTLLKTEKIDGINIDIEYAGTVTPGLRNAYTAYIRQLSTTLKRYQPDLHISLDVFADSAIKERIWDISALAESVDHIIVMSYDFFRSSSPQSGPVAPIFGSEKNRWDIDIIRSLKAFLEQAPSEKIVLGIPFYGYEWQTVSHQPGANTYPRSGGIATYKRVQKLLLDQDISEQWDRDALSPYLTYTEAGKIQTIYYENSQSLAYKLDLVKQANLGGIAIWALGYEGENTELWETIRWKIRD